MAARARAIQRGNAGEVLSEDELETPPTDANTVSQGVGMASAGAATRHRANPSGTGVPRAPPNTQNLIPYVEIPRGPVEAVRRAQYNGNRAGNSSIARDKERSRTRRQKAAQAREAREREVHGGLIRHDKPCVFRVIHDASHVDVDVHIACDIDHKGPRPLPVARTGWVGTRLSHADEDKEPQALEWYLRRGFTVVETDRRRWRDCSKTLKSMLVSLGGAKIDAERMGIMWGYPLEADNRPQRT
ncbi:hypothetical protein L226DRAFT_520410 [Lentinus tigrinus ALCF2SS1-7]|uniref:uncharacterized protein n=1 Tax=Lentinus tigrinus ALCF2SS1-7 TaxID=1328758 RepID=UPI001165FB0C|nr:hypothetical protein L226DRAFT_520410 [Lentinus tigrinus ALCF2SS1-7]